jgi:hypothetical protein
MGPGTFSEIPVSSGETTNNVQTQPHRRIELKRILLSGKTTMVA